MNAFSEFINSFLFSYKFWLIFLIICGILLSRHLFVVINCLNTAATGKTKYVFITDCDSELGYKLATNLCASKIYIIAGCSSEENARKLEEDINFNGYAFHLDVTNKKHIQHIYDQMKDHLQYIGLWGIVHTKHAYSVGPIDFEKIEDVRTVIDTNLVGVVNITTIFLPWLKKMRGRVVCVTNSNEALTTYTASCNMTTAAIESFCYSFTREMKPWSMSAHLVDMGVDSYENEDQLYEMWKNNWNSVNTVTKQQYGQEYPQQCVSQMVNSDNVYRIKVANIVENINHALLSSNPQHKYHSSTLRSYVHVMMEIIPESIKDLFMEIMNPIIIPKCFIPVRRKRVKRY